jgi:hypothetical protein
MKLEIRHPSGFEVTFEGDEQDFDRLRGFLDELPQIAGEAASTTDSKGNSGTGDDKQEPRTIDVHALDAQLQEVGAKSDIERVTVMAQKAVEAKSEGIEYATAEQLFDDLGLPKPQKIRATFQNAKSRGFVKRVGRGTWQPTVAGENFAKYGGKGRRSGKTVRSQQAESDEEP